MNAARLAAAGKAGEPRAAGADAPGGNGDSEGADGLRDLFNVNAAPRQCAAERAVVFCQRRRFFGVGAMQEISADAGCHGAWSLRKCSTVLPAVPQKGVGQNAGHHRLAHGHGPNADTGIMAALGLDVMLGAVAANGAAGRQD